MPLITRRALLTAAGAGFVVSTTGGAYAGLIEPSLLLDVTEYRFNPPRWPADLPLTIAVISDTHVCEPYVPLSRVKQIVETVNRLQPDLIVHLGDHEASYKIAKDRVPRNEYCAVYADLHAPLGLYTILGNHDWWHDAREIRAALDTARIRVMSNEAELVEHAGRRFWIGGLGDQLAHWLGGGSFQGEDDLPGTMAQITTNDPVLLLIHEPEAFDAVTDRVSLTLAGHTHGGQIYIPGIRNPFIPKDYSGRFRYGHVVENNRHMIISGGIGMSGVPIRFGVPPEVLLVRLGQQSAVV